MLETINYSLIEGIDEINNQILEKESKVNAITEFVKKINNQGNYTEYMNNQPVLVEANSVRDIIKSQLKSLELLRDRAKEINKRVVSLLACVQNKENDEAYYNLQINTIKEQLEIYNLEIEKIKKSSSYDATRVDAFFNNSIVRKYSTFKASPSNIKEAVATHDVTVSSKSGLKDNRVLVISEKERKVYLPYRLKDLQEYLLKYPKQYRSEQEVIQKEYICPIDNYIRFPAISRFKETYSLIRDREAKSFIEALKYALDLMFRTDLNPAVIAACRSQTELENYLHCLNTKSLNEFKDFEIRFKVNPV